VSGLFTPWSEREVFSITPVMAGAGRGTGALLFGAALIGASFLLPGAGLFGTQGLITGAATGTFSGLAATSGLAGTLTAVGTSLSYVGAGLVLSGISTILSPMPKPPREAAKLESNSFSGVVQTARQGVPVPIAYGRLFVGSAVISSGLDIDQV